MQPSWRDCAIYSAVDEGARVLRDIRTASENGSELPLPQPNLEIPVINPAHSPDQPRDPRAPNPVSYQEPAVVVPAEAPRTTAREEQSRRTEVQAEPANPVRRIRRSLVDDQVDHPTTQRRRLDTDFVPSRVPAPAAAVPSHPAAHVNSPANPHNNAPFQPLIFVPELEAVDALFDREGMNISERVRLVFDKFFLTYTGTSEAGKWMERIKRADRVGGVSAVQDWAERFASGYERHFNME